MAKNYYFIDGTVSAGQSTLTAISNESSSFGIGATTDIDAGVVTAVNGFISVGNTTPITITLVGNSLTLSAVGIGSTTLTLA